MALERAPRRRRPADLLAIGDPRCDVRRDASPPSRRPSPPTAAVRFRSGGPISIVPSCLPQLFQIWLAALTRWASLRSSSSTVKRSTSALEAKPHCGLMSEPRHIDMAPRPRRRGASARRQTPVPSAWCSSRTEHDNFILRHEAQRLEIAGARCVVFEEEAVEVEPLGEQPLGDWIVAAISPGPWGPDCRGRDGRRASCPSDGRGSRR